VDKAKMIRPQPNLTQKSATKACESPPLKIQETGIRQDLGHVVADLVVLAELQGQLFRSDAREIFGQIIRPAAIGAAAALFVQATVLVCLLAIAEGLVAVGLPRAGAYTLAAGVGMIVAVGLAVWTWRQYRRIPHVFARSREELMQNLTWIKNAAKGLAAQPEQSESDWRTASDLHFHSPSTYKE
jgi:hypothetical protein